MIPSAVITGDILLESDYGNCMLRQVFLRL